MPHPIDGLAAEALHPLHAWRVRAAAVGAQVQRQTRRCAQRVRALGEARKGALAHRAQGDARPTGGRILRHRPRFAAARRRGEQPAMGGQARTRGCQREQEAVACLGGQAAEEILPLARACRQGGEEPRFAVGDGMRRLEQGRGSQRVARREGAAGRRLDHAQARGRLAQADAGEEGPPLADEGLLPFLVAPCHQTAALDEEVRVLHGGEVVEDLGEELRSAPALALAEAGVEVGRARRPTRSLLPQIPGEVAVAGVVLGEQCVKLGEVRLSFSGAELARPEGEGEAALCIGGAGFEVEGSEHHRLVALPVPDHDATRAVEEAIRAGTASWRWRTAAVAPPTPAPTASCGRDIRTGPEERSAVQGNILLGPQILAGMERAFLSTPGELAVKLMAALQGANVPGADTLCLAAGKPARSAFIRVARPGDSRRHYALELMVNDTPPGANPIDLLQEKFDAWLAPSAPPPAPAAAPPAAPRS